MLSELSEVLGGGGTELGNRFRKRKRRNVFRPGQLEVDNHLTHRVMRGNGTAPRESGGKLKVWHPSPPRPAGYGLSHRIVVGL